MIHLHASIRYAYIRKIRSLLLSANKLITNAVVFLFIMRMSTEVNAYVATTYCSCVRATALHFFFCFLLLTSSHFPSSTLISLPLFQCSQPSNFSWNSARLQIQKDSCSCSLSVMINYTYFSLPLFLRLILGLLWWKLQNIAIKGKMYEWLLVTLACLQW